MAGSTQTLDAPDLNVRRIRLKAAYNPGSMRDRDYQRLAVREGVENEVMRTGGRVKAPITSTDETPFQYGQRLRQKAEGYRAGYGNMPGTAPTQPQNSTVTPSAYTATADQFRSATASNSMLPPTPRTAQPTAPSNVRSQASAPVRPRMFGAPEKLVDRAAPGTGLGQNTNYVGTGGHYSADFATEKSAKTFADFAAAQPDESPSTAIAAKPFPARKAGLALRADENGAPPAADALPDAVSAPSAVQRAPTTPATAKPSDDDDNSLWKRGKRWASRNLSREIAGVRSIKLGL